MYVLRCDFFSLDEKAVQNLMGNLKGCLSHSHFLTHTHILTDTSEMKKSAANSLVDTCLKCSPVGDRKKFFILLDTISLPGWVGVIHVFHGYILLSTLSSVKLLRCKNIQL